MFPQAPGTGRSSQNSIQHLSSGLEPTSVQGIPVIPSSVMMSTAGPSSGYVMHQGFTGSVNMTPVPSGSLNMQPNQNKMWQQPHQNSFKPQDLHNQQLNEKSQQPKDYKHRDYLKQQQRLKAMPLSFSKGMSADTLIGNLLDKKDTFTPKPGAVGKQTADRAEAGGHMSQVRLLGPTVNDGASGVMGPQDNLPGWLSPSSSRLPPIYSHIWSLVADPASGGMLVDTNKILALLLTSGLPKEVLGFIWNLATNGANIQLNQQQLYIALALVALAQMGCTFNNLSVLNFIPTPPIPTFNMNVPKSAPDDKSKKSESTVKAPPPTTVSSFPLPSSAIGAMGPAFTVPLQEVASPVHRPILTEDYDFADDFTDFQSADTNSIQPSNLCSDFLTTAVIQPSLTAKQVVNELNHSVVTKLGRSHGRSIGSRLANHTLGAPKPHYNTKLRRPSVDNDNVYIQDDFSSNTERNFTYVRDQKGDSKYPDNSENEDFSDFQVAAGLNVNVDELFPKCHPKTKSQDFMLKESAIRNESDNEEVGKNKEDELPSLDSPTSSKHTAMEIKGPPTQLSLPVITPPPTNPTRELMSIEEDRYSALRFVELENTRSSVSATSIEPSKNAEADDFGDFVSADDLFAEIAVRNTGNSTSQCNTLSNNPVRTSSIQNVEFPVDDWGIQDVFQSSQDSQQPALFDSKTSSETKRLDILSTDFSDLSISKEINDPLAKMNTSSKWNFDFSIGKESLNLNSNCSENASEKDDEFGDFIGTDLTQIEEANSKTPSSFLGDQLWTDSNSSKVVPGVLSDNRSVSSLELPGVTLSRHGSLPSLDLNLFPGNDDIIDKSWNSQVLDWLRCIENSCSLLQAAARTFTNISSHSVLMEVLGTAEGRNYLSNLLEVHRVTWRIQRSYQRSGHESNQVDTVLSSIQKVWSTLQTFYKLANIETAVEKDGSDEESGQPACGVCGSPASRGVLEYGGHVYHAPCANLWLNCVDRTLPAHSPLL